MKALLATIEYPPQTGGVSNYYENLVKFWPAGELRVLDNQNNQLLARHFWPKWRRSFFALKRELKYQKPEWLVVGQILPLGTVVWLLSFFYSFRYCLIFHGMDLELAFSGRKKYLSRKIINRASKIVCANNFTAERLKTFNPAWAEKIAVVNPGISPEAENFVLGGANAGFNLLSVGRLVKRKGVDQVLKALEILEASEKNKSWWKDLHYFIVGAGSEDEYLRAIVKTSSADLQSKITFTGAVVGEEKWRLLNACSVFVMPSRNIAGDFEGFGIVYLEAGLCGKPVLAGRAGGVSDAVIHGETGLLVNPEDPGAIAQAIKKLAENEDLRQELGRKGQAHARSFFWPKQAEKFQQFLLK